MFANLHVHTEYSLLDGMSKIEELILKAKEMGQSALAITDHGSSSGLYEAWKLSKKHNFPVLLGEEFYYENEVPELKTGHIILIAKNETGLKNIFKLQSLAYKNVYYKPRINLDMLADYYEGLICTTACIANPVGQLLLMGEVELAKQQIERFYHIFKNDFYIELQSATNPDVITVNKLLSEIIKENDYKCVITTDSHYINKEDYEVHEVLLCLQQKKKMSDKKRWKFEYNDYWLKSVEEMKTFSEGIPKDVFDMCLFGVDEVIQKCMDVNFDDKTDHLPKFTSDGSENIKLRMEVQKGIENKLIPRGEYTEEMKKGIEHELEVIEDIGYSGYFLIVQEYVKWAKENGIPVGDGRGSAAGSKVVYTIDITDINPVSYDLLFERFLSKGRTPDIDVDFADIDAVFRHLQEKYGEDNVARVGAFTTFTCKSATRKIMSAFGFSQAAISKIVSYMPDELSFTLDDAINHSKEFKQFLDENKHIEKIIRRLEGLINNQSTHAGGVVICEGLTEMLPVIRRADDKDKMILGLDKHAVEELGQYKFDILGVSSLSLLQNIYEQIGEVKWQDIDLEDSNIYNMLCEGDVLGVFQLAEQVDKVCEMKPKHFEDLISLNALIRPGVCDWNEFMSARINNDDNKELPFMKQTHGKIIYQEQYEQLAEYYAGWDIAFSDKYIRKNKHLKEDKELHDKWIKDTNDNGYEPHAMETLWKTIIDIVAGGYSFNKSHAASYANLSFRTAWLKYYHPNAFYAAYLTKNNGDTEKMTEAIAEMKRKGIKLIKPDINESEDKFIPTSEGIMLPINSMKGVGGSVVYAINQLKPIKSFDDFMERRIKKFCKKTAIAALIKGGAFDSFGKSKKEMLETVLGEECKEEPEYKYEKEIYGFYITKSPFDSYTSLKDFNKCPDNSTFMTVLEINEISERFDRRGEKMAFITGMNNINTIRIIVFASNWKNVDVSEGDLVFVKGKKDKSSLIAHIMERV